MNAYPPLSDALRAEIDSLSDDLDAVLTKRPRQGAPELEDRRRLLLGKYLEDTPPADLKPINCIGDSNTMFFAGSERLRFIRYRRSALLKPNWINRGLDLLPVFRVFHVGPATAWKAGDPGSSTRSREKLEILFKRDVPRGSKVILSFGEIDCRIHMARAVKGGRKIEGVTAATADKFIRLPQWIQSIGYRPLVWGPPQIIPNDENQAESFPFVGPWEMRRDITYSYIEQLRNRCNISGIPFVALAGKYHPRDAKPDTSFFHDGTHLSQRLMPLALRELAEIGYLPPGCVPV
ncbi:hypothetical protein [Haloferula rosea]|uniref:Uncharacterized protein n=1 Tax=Haloferula rosea TaxID=490093 RepID=A0A934R9S0_9BACT|nr:hypothetical protein [Haloferula rosea]MBK1825808.1 hypothetical protein [Haloferula rosea]